MNSADMRHNIKMLWAIMLFFWVFLICLDAGEIAEMHKRNYQLEFENNRIYEVLERLDHKIKKTNEKLNEHTKLPHVYGSSPLPRNGEMTK